MVSWVDGSRKGVSKRRRAMRSDMNCSIGDSKRAKAFMHWAISRTLQFVLPCPRNLVEYCRRGQAGTGIKQKQLVMMRSCKKKVYGAPQLGAPPPISEFKESRDENLSALITSTTKVALGILDGGLCPSSRFHVLGLDRLREFVP